MRQHLILLVWLCGGVSSLEFVHHDNEALKDFLLDINTTYPDITHLYSIGHSVQGQDLWVISIGKTPRDYVELRPNVKYIGNMYGYEAVSREVLIYLVNHYVESYGVNSTITEYLDTTLVHIMPAMNPDGYDESTPNSCSERPKGGHTFDGILLSRDFPDLLDNSSNSWRPRAIETKAVIEWISQHTFVISASIHSHNVIVANYPYDQYKPGSLRIGQSLTPDDDVFRFLALTYSRSHRSMAANNSTHCDNDFFPDGIVNGADWYPITGGMQDYNYLQEGIMEIWIGIACCPFPHESTLENYWNENRDALLNFNFEVHRGIKGIIKDENKQPIERAELTIKGRESVNFHSSKHGEYFRVLLPGTYTLQVLADKYIFTSTNVTVVDGRPTRQDFTLKLAPTTISPPTTSTTPAISTIPTNNAVPAKSVTSMQDIVCMCGWISIMFRAYL